ncbi:hypothetical protein Leryth_019532 [Lithospermum erythrorhizon]|nr:hypothetical protein Leryth_019532 [Lithospermum erythrorhizon]
MLTYPGDTSATFHSHKRRANYRDPTSSKASKLQLGTRFELVEDETLDSYAFVDSSESWIHCCFNAKDDSSINNFFAELQYFYPSGPSVTTCKILTPGETQVGCGNCKSVTHPIVGYRGGSLGNINHASYEMSDDHEEDSPATTIGYPVTTNPFVPDSPTFNPVPNLDLVAWVE